MSKHKHKNHFTPAEPTPEMVAPQECPSDAPECVESNDKAPEVEVMPEPEEALVEPSEASEEVLTEVKPEEAVEEVKEEPVEQCGEEVTFFKIKADTFVNLRERTSTESKSRRVIEPGDVLTVTECVDSDWYMVWDHNKNPEGYVMRKFFTRID